MNNYVYTAIIAMTGGFIISFVGISLHILLRKCRIKKRHGFHDDDFASLQADASILSLGRQDHSSQFYK